MWQPSGRTAIVFWFGAEGNDLFPSGKRSCARRRNSPAASTKQVPAQARRSALGNPSRARPEIRPGRLWAIKCSVLRRRATKGTDTRLSRLSLGSTPHRTPAQDTRAGRLHQDARRRVSLRRQCRLLGRACRRGDRADRLDEVIIQLAYRKTTRPATSTRSGIAGPERRKDDRGETPHPSYQHDLGWPGYHAPWFDDGPGAAEDSC